MNSIIFVRGKFTDIQLFFKNETNYSKQSKLGIYYFTGTNCIDNNISEHDTGIHENCIRFCTFGLRSKWPDLEFTSISCNGKMCNEYFKILKCNYDKKFDLYDIDETYGNQKYSLSDLYFKYPNIIEEMDLDPEFKKQIVNVPKKYNKKLTIIKSGESFYINDEAEEALEIEYNNNIIYSSLENIPNLKIVKTNNYKILLKQILTILNNEFVKSNKIAKDKKSLRNRFSLFW